jgi:hypothetical protein
VPVKPFRALSANLDRDEVEAAKASMRRTERYLRIMERLRGTEK